MKNTKRDEEATKRQYEARVRVDNALLFLLGEGDESRRFDLFTRMIKDEKIVKSPSAIGIRSAYKVARLPSNKIPNLCKLIHPYNESLRVKLFNEFLRNEDFKPEDKLLVEDFVKSIKDRKLIPAVLMVAKSLGFLNDDEIGEINKILEARPPEEVKLIPYGNESDFSSLTGSEESEEDAESDIADVHSAAAILVNMRASHAAADDVIATLPEATSAVSAAQLSGAKRGRE